MKLQIELQIAVVGAKETVWHKSMRVSVWFDEFRQRVHTLDGCIDMTST